MYPYWLLFGFFAFGALIGEGRSGPDDRRFRPGLLLGLLVVVVMVGLRDRVGVDWDNYVEMMRLADAEGHSWDDLLGFSDPGYQFLNLLALKLGAGLWPINLVCAAIFTWGLVRFVQQQPFPWLAILVAIPYLVIVVAMNYTRQSVAIGFLLAGLASLTRGGSFWRFLILVAAGAVFHPSVLVAVPLALVGQSRGRLAQFTLLPAGFFFLLSVLNEQVDQYVTAYVSRSMESQGAAIRVAMCVFPAIIFLLLRDRFRFERDESTLWRNYSLAALGLAVLLFALPSSTAVDRIALYILPLQIAILGRLPFVLNSELQAKILILIGAAAVLFVWLNFAFNASAWIPYRNVYL